jgi:hypothetical protein
MVETIVLPFFEIDANNWMTCNAVVESSPVVGSSKNIMFGLVMS